MHENNSINWPQLCMYDTLFMLCCSSSTETHIIKIHWDKNNKHLPCVSWDPDGNCNDVQLVSRSDHINNQV